MINVRLCCESTLGILAERVAVLAVHEDVAARLQLIQYSDLDVQTHCAGAAAGTNRHVEAGRFEGVDHERKSSLDTMRRRAPVFAARDVLQMTAVSLDALKVETCGDVDAFGHGERFGWTEHTRSTETDVDVKRHRIVVSYASAAASNSSTPSL